MRFPHFHPKPDPLTALRTARDHWRDRALQAEHALETVGLDLQIARGDRDRWKAEAAEWATKYAELEDQLAVQA